MKRQTKLASQAQQLPELKSQQTAAHEFASAEALLRHDAEQTTVPPAVAQRLDESIQSQPRPPRSLWRRLLGR
jgi:hypothetical protein